MRYIPLLLLALFAALPGCALNTQLNRDEHRVATADQAGSVSIAPLPAVPWTEVAAELQPKFSLDEKAALDAVIPDTNIFDQAFQDAIALAAVVKGGTQSITRTGSTSLAADGTSSTTRQETKSSTSGTPPSDPPSVGSTEPGTSPPGATGVANRLVPVKLGSDPALRYLAATALFQEVKLLNRYVRDAARFPGAQAFVVRLQLSVIPLSRGLPYDTLTDITLHAADLQPHAGLGQVRNRPVTCPAGTWDTISVLPMLVTDTLEGRAVSSSAEQRRALSLALLGQIGMVGAGAKVERQRRLAEQVVGRDLNSTFMVAKLADDTVRVRLGAVQSPTSGYAMIPRTHLLSLLVVFRPCAERRPLPEGDYSLTVISRTRFFDAKTGIPLPMPSYTKRYAAAAVGISKKYDAAIDETRLKGLYAAASRQNLDDFNKSLDEIGGSNETLAMHRQDRATAFHAGWNMTNAGIWSEVLGFRGEGEFSFTELSLPLHISPPALPRRSQTATLVAQHDQLCVAVGDARGLLDARASAMLVSDGAKRPALANRVAAVAADGTGVAFSFPMIKDWDKHQWTLQTIFAPSGPTPAELRGSIDFATIVVSGPGDCVDGREPEADHPAVVEKPKEITPAPDANANATAKAETDAKLKAKAADARHKKGH